MKNELYLYGIVFTLLVFDCASTGGDLESWNYDTFQVTWHDTVEGKGFMQFSLNPEARSIR